MKYDNVSSVALGVLYLAAGIVILKWPTLLYWGVAAIFFVHGALMLSKLVVDSIKGEKRGSKTPDEHLKRGN